MKSLRLANQVVPIWSQWLDAFGLDTTEGHASVSKSTKSHFMSDAHLYTQAVPEQSFRPNPGTLNQLTFNPRPYYFFPYSLGKLYWL